MKLAEDMSMHNSTMRLFGVTLLIIISGSWATAHEPYYLSKNDSEIYRIVMQAHIPRWEHKVVHKLIKNDENPKLTAITLAVFLGTFGVHRLYLGTAPKVPVIYTLTLGGGMGLLPLADIIAIITTKNIEHFRNNNKVVMWIK